MTKPAAAVFGRRGLLWCPMATPSSLFFESTRAPLKLGRKLGSGGEGEVYEHRATGSAVKLLKQPTPELEEKLRAMRLTPPKAPGVLPQGYAFSWPKDFVVSGQPSGPFVGFTMPAVSYRYALHQLYKPGTRGPEVDERFLLRATKNMAACVASLHQMGVLVGDLNESNIVVGPTGEVTFLDPDSFQIRASGRTYRCLVGKSEFTARELFGRKYADQDRTRDSDAFALAVCIWLCLMEGNHPFASCYTGPGNGATLKERIEQGIWAYAKNRHPHYKPRPMAPPFSSLPPNLRDLFRDAFEVGHHEPWKRPKPADWALALAACETQLARRKPAEPSVTVRVRSALRGIRRQLDLVSLFLPPIHLPTVTPAVRTWAGRAGVAAAASMLTAAGLLLVKAQSTPPQPTQPNAVRPVNSAPKTVSHVPGEETPRLWDELRRSEPTRLTKRP